MREKFLGFVDNAGLDQLTLYAIATKKCERVHERLIIHCSCFLDYFLFIWNAPKHTTYT